MSCNLTDCATSRPGPAVSLEAKRVLHLTGEPRLSGFEVEAATLVLRPALIENQKDFITRLDDPADAALPAEIARLVVELHEVEERQVWRHRIISPRHINARHEIALPQAREGLLCRHAHLKARRELVLERRRQLIGVA